MICASSQIKETKMAASNGDSQLKLEAKSAYKNAHEGRVPVTVLTGEEEM